MFDLSGMVVSSHEGRKVRRIRKSNRVPEWRKTFYLSRPNSVRNQERTMYAARIVARDGTIKKIVLRKGQVNETKQAFVYSKLEVGRSLKTCYVPRVR
jgi:hypothetical protein